MVSSPPESAVEPVNGTRIQELLELVRDGRVSVAEAREQLAHLPILDLGHTRLDTHRELRCGAGEVVFGQGKSSKELLEIARSVLQQHERLLITRLSDADAATLYAALPCAEMHARARCLTVGLPHVEEGDGLVLVVSAGTADAPVAEEAALAARFAGARVGRIADVGVAGLHRVLDETPRLREARVLVVVAGMEGALPSVVAGLVGRPVIAVPTSVGYGASFGGLAALLAMLNACAAGVTVVNIDNGLGAGMAAARINRLGLPAETARRGRARPLPPPPLAGTLPR
jgi:NCAIR mutase (PurE)-related protein